tara:strand:- start:394 stop:819 length:426 start_codon:yes stop_codon:yes gene_type:complete
MPEKRQRINTFHTWALISVAFTIDGVQFFISLIPFVGVLIASGIAFFVRIVFWVWFKVLGVGFADTSSRYFVNFTLTFMEIIPFVNMLPAWGIGTVAIIRQVKKEDARYNKRELEKYQETMTTSFYPNKTPKPVRNNRSVQ